MTVALVTPPAAQPVTLDALREHLRIVETDEDAYLADLLAAACAHVEQASGRRLVTQTWRRYVGTLPPGRAVDLRLGPVQRIEAVTLYDAEGSPSQATPDEWRLIDERLHLARVDAANGIEIDVVCGYGDAPDDVPAPLVRAILMLAAHWHEFRGAVAPKDQPVSMPPGFAELVRPFRRIGL